MIILLSPSKTLDLETPIKVKEMTQPEFLEEAIVLNKKLKKLSRTKLAELMKISPQLAELNYGRNQEWSVPFTKENARPAALCFKGDVYEGLQATSFKAADWKYAQKHLRILSGLYGLLRPLDLMQAYRLEMGTKWEITAKTKNLYQFWDEKLKDNLNALLEKDKQPAIVNLASNEYFKAAKAKKISSPIITPVFKDFKNGQYKVISFFAKKARGLMAAYIIKNKLKVVEDLKNFDGGGYVFKEDLSDGGELVFVR